MLMQQLDASAGAANAKRAGAAPRLDHCAPRASRPSACAPARHHPGAAGAITSLRLAAESSPTARARLPVPTTAGTALPNVNLQSRKRSIRRSHLRAASSTSRSRCTTRDSAVPDPLLVGCFGFGPAACCEPPDHCDADRLSPTTPCQSASTTPKRPTSCRACTASRADRRASGTAAAGARALAAHLIGRNLPQIQFRARCSRRHPAVCRRPSPAFVRAVAKLHAQSPVRARQPPARMHAPPDDCGHSCRADRPACAGFRCASASGERRPRTTQQGQRSAERRTCPTPSSC